jgi:RNA polymerase sigma-70 factor (ECF subfamily)
MDALYRAHRGAIWGLCYRMTGAAADADELTQETFARALERPPRGEPRAWLWAVALNLSRDHLRRRRRRAYAGPWLPEPVWSGDDDWSGWASLDPSPEARYAMVESASFAFLVALEALSPRQRAVLLLRDVLGDSTQEVAGALQMTVANVKVCLHRARAALRGYDQARAGAAPPEAQQEALWALMGCLAQGDRAGLEALLAEGARLTSDSGGAWASARRVLEGPARISAFLLGISRWQARAEVSMARINGGPAVVVSLVGQSARLAPVTALRLDVGADGRLLALHLISAPEKLRGRAPSLQQPV